jgi:hypothetical protein
MFCVTCSGQTVVDMEVQQNKAIPMTSPQDTVTQLTSSGDDIVSSSSDLDVTASAVNANYDVMQQGRCNTFKGGDYLTMT